MGPDHPNPFRLKIGAKSGHQVDAAYGHDDDVGFYVDDVLDLELRVFIVLRIDKLEIGSEFVRVAQRSHQLHLHELVLEVFVVAVEDELNVLIQTTGRFYPQDKFNVFVQTAGEGVERLRRKAAFAHTFSQPAVVGSFGLVVQR